ncbi:MAG: ABC transporter ATP-binding protein [Propylenella sp.]
MLVADQQRFGSQAERREPLGAVCFSVRIDGKTFQRATGGDVAVIRGLEFELVPETFTCLIGPSGCGKTTTLRIMLRLDEDFDGAVSRSLSETRIAAVFQEPRLLPWRTVEQNISLALPPELAGKDLAPILDAVELAHFRRSYPSELSLGMARRVALARAYSVEPEILLLDEPFVSLDEATANRLRQLLIDLWQSSPVTVLMVTHNIREAVRLADRLVILSPRPAHVVGTVDLPMPREERRGPPLDALLADLSSRYPSLTLE